MLPELMLLALFGRTIAGIELEIRGERGKPVRYVATGLTRRMMDIASRFTKAIDQSRYLKAVRRELYDKNPVYLRLLSAATIGGDRLCRLAWLVARVRQPTQVAWLFAAPAFVCNPVFKLHVERDLHAVVNIATAAIIAAEPWRRRSRVHRVG